MLDRSTNIKLLEFLIHSFDIFWCANPTLDTPTRRMASDYTEFALLNRACIKKFKKKVKEKNKQKELKNNKNNNEKRSKKKNKQS